MNIFQWRRSFMRASRGKCSMQYKIALEWDEAFKNMNDPSEEPLPMYILMLMQSVI
jgi:hypothetical protein